MLDPRPFLTERLKALGVFSGIAIAGVAGFELVITGSLDPITPSLVADAPSEYDEETVMQAWHYRPYVPTVYVTEASQQLGYPIDEAVFDDLAGAPDDPTAPEAAVYRSSEDEDLQREIERLYLETERMAAEQDAEFDRGMRESEPQVSDATEPTESLDETMPEPVELLPERPLELEDELEPPPPEIAPKPVEPRPMTLTAYENASPS